MLITDTTLIQALTNQLSMQQDSIAQLQMQLASGQVLNRPSDNPTAVTQVLALSSQASQLASWQANAEMAKSWLGTSADAANSVINAMQSARSLLLGAANQGVQDPTSYQAIGSQLQGIITNLRSLSNSQYGDRPIFAGTSASAQAYDASGNYLGNSDAPTVVIGPGAGAGQTVDLSVPGTALFGSGASSVFATLSAASNALLTGAPTSAEISTALNALDGNISTAEQASATLGNAALQVSNSSATLSSQIANIQANQATLEDVNLASATTQLDSDMTNYQAALWAASRAIPETLAKFVAP
ncbi:hypothetical protein EPN29_14070 [bacterium]|nr:MAG: hypothetical protein EPN29_14070 [bacterium]